MIINGKLKVRKWEKDDRSGTSVEIEAEAIGHDVRWGVSKFEKRVGAQVTTEPTQNNESSGHSIASLPSVDEQPMVASAPPNRSGFLSTDSHESEMSDDGFTPKTEAA